MPTHWSCSTFISMTLECYWTFHVLAFIENENKMEWEHATTYAPAHSCHSPIWELTISFVFTALLLQVHMKGIPKRHWQHSCNAQPVYNLLLLQNKNIKKIKTQWCHFMKSGVKLGKHLHGWAAHTFCFTQQWKMDLWSETCIQTKSGAAAYRCKVSV